MEIEKNNKTGDMLLSDVPGAQGLVFICLPNRKGDFSEIIEIAYKIARNRKLEQVPEKMIGGPALLPVRMVPIFKKLGETNRMAFVFTDKDMIHEGSMISLVKMDEKKKIIIRKTISCKEVPKEKRWFVFRK